MLRSGRNFSNPVACGNRKVINVSKELGALAKEVSRLRVAGASGFPLLLQVKCERREKAKKGLFNRKIPGIIGFENAQPFQVTAHDTKIKKTSFQRKIKSKAFAGKHGIYKDKVRCRILC